MNLDQGPNLLVATGAAVARPGRGADVLDGAQPEGDDRVHDRPFGHFAAPADDAVRAAGTGSGARVRAVAGIRYQLRQGHSQNGGRGGISC